MSATPTRCSAFVLVNKKLLEEQGIVDGVRAYVAAHGLEWDVIPLDPARGWTEVLLQRAQPRGVFVGRPRPEPGATPAATYPWVNWGEDRGPAPGDAVVRFDARAIGRVAVEYLRRAGARTLALVREKVPETFTTKLARNAGFRSSAETVGMDVQVLSEGTVTLEDYYRRLRELSAALPRPMGVFCYHDREAESLIDDLLHVGLAVPRDVMVLGGNGSASAAGARIPISSVHLPYPALGRAAAGLAHQLLSGTRPDPALVEVAPTVVDERASTAVRRRSADPLVARALERIERGNLPIPGVVELARHCGCRRQLLFDRFRRELGCSPQRWIEERAMQRAARLLADTDLDMTGIARQCGFAHRTNLSRQFRKRFGIAPSAYRRLEQ